MPRWVLPLLGLVMVGAGCGRSYADDNRAIIEELPAPDHVSLLDEDHYRYCKGETCLFGEDGSGALLTYAVDTDHYTLASLVEAYRVGLPGWEARVELECADEDPWRCAELATAFFTRGDERIDLNLDNWPAGQFEVNVDAEGA